MTEVIRGKVAVITGASSGIGKATALALAREGAAVILAARRGAELEEVAAACRGLGARAIAVETDVTSDDDCRRLIERATSEMGHVDILINNAGYAIFDRTDEASLAEWQEMMDTNFFGAVRCTRLALPQMLARGRGSIVNVASITGLMGFARMGGYCATKFALVGWSEALRNEVKKAGVSVSLVCPGTTDTGFFRTAERGKMPAASRLVLAIPPERVARAILRIIRSGSPRTVVPVTAAMYMKFKAIFPRAAHALMREVSGLIERSSS